MNGGRGRTERKGRGVDGRGGGVSGRGDGRGKDQRKGVLLVSHGHGEEGQEELQWFIFMLL